MPFNIIESLTITIIERSIFCYSSKLKKHKTYGTWSANTITITLTLPNPELRLFKYGLLCTLDKNKE